MGWPVSTVAAGGLPIVDVTATSKIGMPVSEAPAGFGHAVTKVTNGYGMPVIYVSPTGGATGTAGLVQKNAGTVNLNASLVTSLGAATKAGNSILIFANGSGTIATPSGFTSRSPQVGSQGFYLFEKLVASGNSTDTPTLTMSGAYNAVWEIAEYAGITAFGTSSGNNSASGNTAWTTPSITPIAGNTLLVSFVGASSTNPALSFTTGDPQGWTNSFTGQQSLARTGAATPAGNDSIISGWASNIVTVNGTTAYSTAATWLLTTPAAPASIIAAYTLASGSTSAYPDATNTGYLNATGGPPTLYTGGAISSNTTYSNKIFDGGVNVGANGAPVSNVTFYGCWFRGHGASGALALLYGDNITFNYCSFTPDIISGPPASYAQGYQYGIEGDGAYNTVIAQLTVTNCEIWGFGNAVDVTGSTQAKPQVFRNNWIHDARADGGVDHTDGIGSLSGAGLGSYVVIDHNNIQSAGNTNGIAFQAGTYSNFTVTNNLFGGFGYCVAIMGGATNITFTDNTFSTKLGVTFGPLYPDAFWPSTQGSLWRRNKWSVPAGAAWGTPANDGKFWIPNSSNSPANDAVFVSATDYAG